MKKYLNINVLIMLIPIVNIVFLFNNYKNRVKKFDLNYILLWTYTIISNVIIITYVASLWIVKESDLNWSLIWIIFLCQVISVLISSISTRKISSILLEQFIVWILFFFLCVMQLVSFLMIEWIITGINWFIPFLQNNDQSFLIIVIIMYSSGVLLSIIAIYLSLYRLMKDDLDSYPRFKISNIYQKTIKYSLVALLYVGLIVYGVDKKINGNLFSYMLNNKFVWWDYSYAPVGGATFNDVVLNGKDYPLYFINNKMVSQEEGEEKLATKVITSRTYINNVYWMDGCEFDNSKILKISQKVEINEKEYELEFKYIDFQSDIITRYDSPPYSKPIRNKLMVNVKGEGIEYEVPNDFYTEGSTLDKTETRIHHDIVSEVAITGYEQMKNNILNKVMGSQNDYDTYHIGLFNNIECSVNGNSTSYNILSEIEEIIQLRYRYYD